MKELIKKNVLEIVSIVVAVSALFFTGLQYWLTQEHNKMSVLPIMIFDYEKSNMAIRNDGLGPAVITGVDIYYDGKMGRMTDFDSIATPIAMAIRDNNLKLDPKDYQIKYFNSFVVVKEDKKLELIKLKSFKKSKQFEKLLELVNFGVCYKSVYDDRFYIKSIDAEPSERSCNYDGAMKMGEQYYRWVDPMEKVISFSDITGR
ncbi:hypothetical protein ACP6IB_26920 [Vibrio harveyi]|uniref:hypothetical protein n=1 Tax=Vibrio harveyi TaxID=669 RepID=UPI003CF77313